MDQTTVPGQTQTTQIPITSTSGQETISLDENESLEITGAHIEELPTEPEEELEENTQPTTTNWNNWYQTNQRHEHAWEKSKIENREKQIREERQEEERIHKLIQEYNSTLTKINIIGQYITTTLIPLLNKKNVDRDNRTLHGDQYRQSTDHTHSGMVLGKRTKTQQITDTSSRNTGDDYTTTRFNRSTDPRPQKLTKRSRYYEQKSIQKGKGRDDKTYRDTSQGKNQTDMGTSRSPIRSSETGRDKHKTYRYPRRQDTKTTEPTIIDID